MKSEIVQNLAEMGDFDEAFVVDVIKMLELPSDMERDVDGPGTNGEGGGDVALEGVADHQQFRGVYLLVLAESEEFALGLVGGNLHVIEVLQQAGTF